MKSETGRQIKSGSLHVVETRQPANHGFGNFLKQTRETIFYRWLTRDQSELYLAEQYDVKRVKIEQTVKAEARERIVPPPVGSSPSSPRESLLACTRPQGIVPAEPGEIRANGKMMRLWRAPESGTEFLQVQGSSDTQWFRLKKVA